MEFEEFCGSEFWDDSLTWNTTNPDFTPCFQKTFLIWVPCGFLWVFLPLEIYFISRNSNIKLPWTGLNVMKALLGTFLVFLSLMEMVQSLLIYLDSDIDIPYADINSPFIAAITYLLATILMLIHRKKGFTSSGIIFIFWLLSSLAMTVTFRSHLMNALDLTKRENKISFILIVISYPMIIAELVLSSVADSEIPPQRKRIRLKNICPENKSSFLNRMMFIWFDKMAWLGFRKSLIQRDLWDLSSDNLTKTIVSKFHVDWKKDLDNYYDQLNSHPEEKIKSPSILSALWRTFKWPFIWAGVLRFTADMLAFASPLILQMLIAYVSENGPKWQGYFYAVILFVASLLQSIVYGQQYLLMFKISLRVRSTAISAIYQKSLKISNSVKRTSTVGEIVNLMSVDVQRLMDLLPELHIIWSAAIQISLALYLLWQQLGPSVLAGLGVMLLVIPINGYIAGHFKSLQFKQMTSKDKRVKLMNEILNGIKILKLYAWEESFSDYASSIREKELSVMKTGAYLNAVASFIFNIVPVIVTLASFATYVLVDEHNVLDPTKAFVSLSLFNIIRLPLFFIPMLFISMIQAAVSFKRMNKFLTSEELDFTSVTHNENTDFPIFVDGGNFLWDSSEASSSSLTNINLKAPEGSLTAVVGPVGSGKSSLLSAILGDMEKVSGEVNLKGSVAYVAQQAWIQNATLRDNITFGKPYDETFYNNVIDACALRPDFSILPGGDLTEIGEKGINLSGGQKQRVSLARAVYSDADVIFLDDPLSAVDSHVGKHIFEKVVGPKGLLKHKTRLFVTNSITYLPLMHSIVVMNNGKITEIGSYNELLEQKGDFATFLMTYLQEHDNEELSEEELTDLEGIAKDLITRIGSPEIERRLSVISPTTDLVISDTESEHVSSSSRLLRRYSSHLSEHGVLQRQLSKKQQIQKMGKLIQIETTETGKVKWAVYMEYIRAVGLLSSILVATSYVLSAAFTVSSNIWLSIWSEDPPLVNNTQNIPLRDMRLGVYGAFGVAQTITVLSGSIILSLANINASRLLHSRMLNNVLKCPMAFFDTTPLGRIVNRFSKDIDIVDTTIPMIIRPLIGTALQVISTLVVISISTPIFMAIILPVGIMFYIIQRLYISASRQLKRLESITRSPIFSHFSESLSGASTIRAYGRSQDFIRESELRVDQNHVCYYPSIIATRWLSIRLELLSNVIVFCAALFAVLNKDTLDAGTVGLSISYAASVSNVLTFMVRMASDLETNIVAVERIQEYAEEPIEAAFKIAETDPKPDWPDKGVIIFQQYSTRYRPGLDLVLKDITCHIHGGEKIGIVGRTGAGKSSLTLALFRIIEPAGGFILVDGVNTGIIGLHALRSKITIIPQDPVLFSGTLRMNLDPFNKYVDEQLWKALELSHLKEFILTLPLGLEYEIAEGGENLSVGQRQLVCLARAILRKTKVLVLDEATAAIDLETDDLIQATIRKEFADCTILTIAHRLNTIMDSTRIILLDNGEIQEFDSPTTLLQNKKSIFYSMAKDAGLI